MNERDIELAKQAGWQYAHGESGFEPLWSFAELIRADEREEIAQFIEQTRLNGLPEQTAFHYAQLLGSFATAIRARGNT